MTDFIVHGIPGSPFLRAVIATLEEKGAPYQLKPLPPGGHRTEAYLAMHPFGRVPVIQHGDFTLYETQAVLRYIDATCDGAALQPKDPQTAARMNQLLGINDWYFFPKIGVPIVFQRIVGPILMGLTPDEAIIAAALPDAANCTGVIKGFLSDRAFLVGDALTLADLHLYPHLAMLAQTPEGRSLMNGTRLEAWLQRMAARPSMIASQPPEALRWLV